MVKKKFENLEAEMMERATGGSEPGFWDRVAKRIEEGLYEVYEAFDQMPAWYFDKLKRFIAGDIEPWNQ